MANTDGMTKKFTVIKDSDIWNANAVARTQLECALDSIKADRKRKARKKILTL